MNTQTKPILIWDPSEIVEDELVFRLTEEDFFPDTWMVEYQLALAKDIKDIRSQSFKDWVQANKKDAMRELIWKDDLFWHDQWSIILDNLQELLDRKNPNGKWRIDGKNMGWRHRSGWKYIDVQKDSHSGAREFLQGILPNTDCTFRIYDEGQKICIANYHHDAPCGETYTCRPCSDKEWDAHNKN